MRIAWVLVVLLLAGCSEPEPEPEEDEECGYGPCDMEFDFGTWMVVAPILATALVLLFVGLLVYALLRDHRRPEQP